MMADGNEIAVPQAMLADASTVHEAAVRAAQVDEQPAFGRLHEQVLEAAYVAAVEADIAGVIAPEHHTGPVKRDLGDDGLAARDDEPGGLEPQQARVAQVHGLG